MQSCKLVSLLLLLLLFTAVWQVTAQSSNGNNAPMAPSMPQVPSMSMPDMPSISPSASGDFYRPQPSSPFRGTPPTPPTPQTPPMPKAPAANPAPAANTGTQTKPPTTPGIAPTLSLANAQNEAGTANANGLSEFSPLSARRISDLGNALGNPLLSTALGNDQLFANQALSGSQSLSRLSGVNANDNNALLRAILERLTALESTQQASSTNGAKTGTNASTAQQNVNQPKILRFSVNGTSILPSCQTIYFSTPEADGTFLCTGDRKYLANGKQVNETFYLLFRPDTAHSEKSAHTAAITVSQNADDPASLMKQCANRSPIQAIRTGNLVTVRLSDNEVKLDLLIDLGANQ